MYREHHRPQRVKPKQLDKYLEKGWYRSGQILFTTHLLLLENDVYSPVWTRLPLLEYRFPKRMRKLFNRNNRKFRVEYGLFSSTIDPQKEALYQQHRHRFGKYPPYNLKDYLLDATEKNAFNTYEARVYDGEKLIAVSFFDVGETSIMSILAIYDQKYDKASLGIYTLLLEIDFALQHGMSYHYSGYIVPEYPRFDYKDRVGKLEFLDMFDDTWKPYDQLDTSILPAQVIRQKIDEMMFILQMFQIPASCYIYRLYDADAIKYDASLLNTPIFITCYNQGELHQESCLIEYDFLKQKYRLSVGKELTEKPPFYHISRLKIVRETNDIDKIVGILLKYKKELRQSGLLQ